LSAATFATHDIATLKGYWLGRDLAWRRDLGLYPSDAAGRQDEQTRSEDRRRLIEALIRENVLRPEAAGQFLSTPAERVDITALGESIHRYLGRTRSCLALLQIEDAIGEEQQANLPGTTDEHPNWRRKLSLTIEDLLGNEHFLRLTAALDASRKESP
jgi:4-alpha-glucanotransferase